MPFSFDLDQCPFIETLIDEAGREMDFTELGDPSRNAGMEALLESMREETWAQMTPKARELATDTLLHYLVNRMWLAADRAAFPEITRQKIEAPLIIVGPPRSGSTLLHTLLSLDPDNMAPEHWICREPSPPIARLAPSPERMEEAQRRMMKQFELVPDIFVTHPYMIEEGSGALAECGSDILSMAGTSQQLWCFWGGETYKRYLLEADHTAALGFHHDFLQHVQWGSDGKRWALKGSDHMLWLAELAARYPDARLIWTHRDLAQQLGSLASVQSILLGLRGHPVTPEQRHAQGIRAIELQHAAIEKAMKAREAIGEDRFIDVSYHDMMADHLGTVRRIYEQCGLEVSPRHEASIRAWLADHHQTKHGVHKHSPTEFGLDARAINERFAGYLDRFGFGFGIRPELTS
ncbi:sulfotransferase family protein [Novosphingobium album (ex Hu et al. 2023)]|uniref:Sulfotransferase n=1 Tax=Novosphingobium album (ex Hu et al. 2023) TaxID=2930093 RepID=A0ABT0B6Z2_9SPHN|nr:sulfotransferase [Novosphingobium album (ex Hu et al. 2023)]MCJ2180846.1 sulfotransferase [Novosphingobium album (ex Hu et al. 2023)]